MKNSVVSIQVGKVKAYGDKSSSEFLDKYWESAFFKEIVNSKISVSKNGLNGDEIADTIHHGGVEKAVFANSYENYREWAEFLHVETLPFGALGENLTISGLHESSVYLGDIHKIGSTLLQVSQPRKPCYKIAKRWNNKKFTNEIYTTGLTGWYYRVLKEGEIDFNDEVIVSKSDESRISILEANMAFANPIKHRDILETILSIDSIAPNYRSSIEKRILGEFALEYMRVD
ncbi:MAG TPA: MOSC domain-containing protein [Sulfurimonas sp.]|uniref:MOSC domain-containing protein n=1 Tax=Sulfurimonas sp. TaxID=2022749 RepID=UPI002B9964D3|nr:MOSC domain-containing protein [Sulfurimonas sp.]HUH42213.1 MOSC domain-containing protein [Sulfurimonas sp.]